MAVALITCMHLVRHFDKFRAQFEALGIEALLPPLMGQQFSAGEMAEHIVGVDAVIAGDDEIDAAVLDAGKASRLKAVVKWGIGTDNVDKAHAARIGMPVFNTPGVFSDEVADMAMSHLLMLTRRTHLMHASVLKGEWFKAEGRTLAGLTAGIIGLGSIGQGIARRTSAFGMTTIGYDLYPPEADKLAQLGVTPVDLDTLFGRSDVVIVACALTPENRGFIGAKAFAAMKDGVIVLNVARGPLIDEAALVDALASGKVAGAGLDVYEDEPLPAAAPLRRFADRCTFSTHNGSNTAEAVARINQMTSDILFDVLGLRPAIGFTPNRVA